MTSFLFYFSFTVIFFSNLVSSLQLSLLRRPLRVLSKFWKRGSNKETIRVETVSEMQNAMEKGYTLRNMDVRGDTAITTTTPTIHHPVVLALHERSKYPKDDAGKRLDGRRVAIAIEGGGMRGCVSAGMISAIWYLDMVKAIDVVYGSSAGALIGAYFVSGQFPYSGPEIYYDLLTSAGTNFIDKLSILRSTGFGLLDLRWSSLKNLVRSRIGRPVLNLDYLLDNTLCKQKPLSETFWKHQVDKTMVSAE